MPAPMNTKCSGFPRRIPASSFCPLFEEILGGSEWPCINRSFFDADRLSQGGFSEKFYERLGLEGGADIPVDTPRADRSRTATRHRGALCCAWPDLRRIFAWRVVWV